MSTLTAFDATYGYDLEALLQVPSPDGPPDFSEFWTRTYTEALAIKPNITKRQIESPDPEYDHYEMEFDSLGGFRAGGWLTIPKNGDFECGTVFGHGYGGRSAAEFNIAGPPSVSIFPCARGFHRSADPQIPNESGGHVIYGIENRETYSHRGSCADTVWCAASALIELFPEVANNLFYRGGSFGGGIGALALPWDNRFKKAYLDVPSFGNHPLRVTLPCTGSGEAVRLYHEKHPEVLEVLAYFDAATSARYFKIPVLVIPALSDPAVPPPGQFAVYNAISSPKEIFVRQTGHPQTESDDPLTRKAIEDWFSTP
jgi:cephalosporin-C deacetylase